MNPYWRFGLLAALSSIALAFALAQIIPPLAGWLLSINLIAVGLYRYDKLVAGTHAMRVPERVLLLLAAAGGSAGAGIAMWVLRPRHKTRSGGFIAWFLIILLIQIVALSAFVYASR